MPWTMLRLEKARTSDQPEGDPTHAYIVHVAVTADGSLDEEAMAAEPRRATVARYKAGEEDCHGWLTRMKDRAWGFSYTAGEDDDEPIVHLEFHRLHVGDYVTITDHTTGEALPFRIVTARPQG